MTSWLKKWFRSPIGTVETCHNQQSNPSIPGKHHCQRKVWPTSCCLRANPNPHPHHWTSPDSTAYPKKQPLPSPSPCHPLPHWYLAYTLSACSSSHDSSKSSWHQTTSDYYCIVRINPNWILDRLLKLKISSTLIAGLSGGKQRGRTRKLSKAVVCLWSSGCTMFLKYGLCWTNGLVSCIWTLVSSLGLIFCRVSLLGSFINGITSKPRLAPELSSPLIRLHSRYPISCTSKTILSFLLIASIISISDPVTVRYLPMWPRWKKGLVTENLWYEHHTTCQHLVFTNTLS